MSVLLPIGKMNMDLGCQPGEHMWTLLNVLTVDSGLETMPRWTNSFTGNNTVTSGHVPCGAMSWQGAGTSRIYSATNDKLWETYSTTHTDVSGSAYTNLTNGVSFATFGQWCLAANGVDKLQIIEVPAATGGAQNFSDHDSNTYATISSLSAVIAPKYICSHKNHVIAADITMKDNYGLVGSFSTTGGGFTNQPAGDTVSVVSSAAGDTTQNITVYGTVTGGGDTVVYKQVALNGVVSVLVSPPAPWTTWEKILAVKKDVATAGNVTLTETSGGLTIIAFTLPATLSMGVYSVPSANQQIGGVTVSMAADAATTRSVGLTGDSNSSGDYDYDSQALSGTTSVVSNMSFVTLLELLTGDLESARTVTVSTYALPTGTSKPYMWWVSAVDSAINFGDETYAPSLVGSTREEALDGDGIITGVIDGGDAWYLFKEKSVYKISGPPWQPKIISRNNGMKAGNQPYRQRDRIYFWGTSGLSYVDLSTEEVVELFPGRMQRTLNDFGNYQYNFNVGTFPQPLTPTEFVNACSTTNVVRIAGDSKYNLVFMTYYNSTAPFGSSLYQGLVYNSKTDEFFFKSMAGTTGDLYHMIEHPAIHPYQFPGSGVSVVAATSATTHRWYHLTPIGFTGSSVAGEESYVRWPFKVFSENQYRPSSIRKVRVLFDDPLADLPAVNPNELGITVKVISLSGQHKSWSISTDSKVSSGSGTTSKDGWIKIDGCPFATKHSIGVAINYSSGTDNNGAKFVNLVGIEVDFEIGPHQALA